MPSPFPGMDPWLEAQWIFPDVHDTLITLLRDAVNAVVPEPYYARSKTRVWVERPKRREPDVGVYSKRSKRNGPGGLAVAPIRRTGMIPVAADARSDPWEKPYLEIYSAEGKRLVTSVEVLSPANKAAGSVGRKEFIKKQTRCLNAEVTLASAAESSGHGILSPRSGFATRCRKYRSPSTRTSNPFRSICKRSSIDVTTGGHMTVVSSTNALPDRR